MVFRNLRQAHLLEVGLTQNLRDRDFKKIQHGIFHDRSQNRFHDRQTPPTNSPKLIEFEACYIEQILPSLFCQQNMQWSCIMVHSYFTLCLRARDYIKRLSQHPWYGLWMRVKDPHHYRVTALGLMCEVALSNLTSY